MKKILAILMIAALLMALAGCAQSSTAQTPTTVQHELSYYSKDFLGLQEYLVDYNLVGYVDMSLYKATSNEVAPTESAIRTSVYYELIGADDGVRFLISGSAFVELYDFSNATSATAKAFLADLKEDGKYIVAEDLNELTGAISKSGKYVILYNEKESAEYENITKVLENW